jgi:hypothetical protein
LRFCLPTPRSWRFHLCWEERYLSAAFPEGFPVSMYCERKEGAFPLFLSLSLSLSLSSLHRHADYSQPARMSGAGRAATIHESLLPDFYLKMGKEKGMDRWTDGWMDRQMDELCWLGLATTKMDIFPSIICNHPSISRILMFSYSKTCNIITIPSQKRVLSSCDVLYIDG